MSRDFQEGDVEEGRVGVAEAEESFLLCRDVGGSVQHQHNEAFGSFSSRGKSKSVLLLNGRNPKEKDFIRIFSETNVVVYKTSDGELPYTTSNAQNCHDVEKAVQNVS